MALGACSPHLLGHLPTHSLEVATRGGAGVAVRLGKEALAVAIEVGEQPDAARRHGLQDLVIAQALGVAQEQGLAQRCRELDQRLAHALSALLDQQAVELTCTRHALFREDLALVGGDGLATAQLVAAMIACHRHEPGPEAAFGSVLVTALPHQHPGVLRQLAPQLHVVHEARAQVDHALGMPLHQRLERAPEPRPGERHQLVVATLTQRIGRGVLGADQPRKGHFPG